MTDAEATALAGCPFCQKPLTRRLSVNPSARCDTEGCWMNARMIAIPLDDPSHVAAWNTRQPAAPDPTSVQKTHISPEAAPRDMDTSGYAEVGAAPATGEVVEMLREARRQLEYLDGRWPTGTTPCIIARIVRALNGGS